MATDALELDEEDIHDEHPSHVVSVIMQDDDNDKKLDELKAKRKAKDEKKRVRVLFTIIKIAI